MGFTNKFPRTSLICDYLKQAIPFTLLFKHNKLCLKMPVYTIYYALQPKHENICTYVMTSPGGFHFPQHKDRVKQSNRKIENIFVGK